MEQRCGPYIFFSNFDSGNLAKVEKNDAYSAAGTTTTADSEGEKEDSALAPEIKADHAFNVWVSPDCAGTQYQNGNRSWFHFGIRGSLSSHTLRITVMNMNRQSKLYSQGYNVIARFFPSRPNWERIRVKPTYRVCEASFMLTFFCTFPHTCDTAYFAFCYPWSYEESQSQLAQLDSQFSYCSYVPPNTENISSDYIYYYRETLCHSLQGRKIDLLTISDYSNMLTDPEPRFDMRLFPERKERCRAFKNKRVFVLSSRVHPGETPGSFVFNGFLNFILRPNDFRARKLRQLFVFKLIPMLNPDGVYCGHYRTDIRGVNLNRVYLDPNYELYPSIYAAKALIIFHHVNNRIKPLSNDRFQSNSNFEDKFEMGWRSNNEVEVSEEEDNKIAECLAESQFLNEEEQQPERANSDLRKSSSAPSCWRSSPEVLMRPSSGTVNNLLTAVETEAKDEEKPSFEIGNEGSDEDDIDFTPSTESVQYAPHLCDKSLLEIPPAMSGVAFYIDLHGHASKRGCFMYGNHLEDETQQVDNMTFAKLVAVNSQHFDFEGCNFTEKNMYMKDRHDNSSKAGAGRVAIYKAIGIIHSYTLECNYNTGRLTNSLSQAVGPGSGRVTPPPAVSYMPLRYAPVQFEEVGKGVAIAALDMFQENPCSRLPTSEFGCLNRVKEWIRYRVLAGRAEARLHRNGNSVAVYASQRNGIQAAPKHRSLSMPAATANNRAPGAIKPIAKVSSNRSPNQYTAAKQPSPIKQPTSPTKRALSFGTKTSSPYFSKPVIGTPTVANPNSDNLSNTLLQVAEPASKWPSISSEVPVSPAAPRQVQVLSMTKIEPSFSASQPGSGMSLSSPQSATQRQLQPSASGRLSANGGGAANKSANDLADRRTSGNVRSAAQAHIDNLRRTTRRPQSRGYSFFSNSHVYPSAPSLVQSPNTCVSKSLAPQSALHRQMSADCAQLRQKQPSQPISAQTIAATLFTKQNFEPSADLFMPQDSTDGITEMLESSALKLVAQNEPSAMQLDQQEAVLPPLESSQDKAKQNIMSTCTVRFVSPLMRNDIQSSTLSGNSPLHRQTSTVGSSYYFYHVRRRNFRTIRTIKNPLHSLQTRRKENSNIR